MKTNLLTTAKVQALSEAGYYLDGMGLYLQVSRWGTKSWVYRFTLSKQTFDMGLGDAATFSLKEARDRARAARQKVLDGINPIEERRQAKQEAAIALLEREPFKEAALQYHRQRAERWRSAKHHKEWLKSLEVYAFPALGALPVSEITPLMVTNALKKVWDTKRVTAERTRQRIEAVLDWVRKGKPLQNGRKAVKHMEALPVDQMPAFMVELRKDESIQAHALEFTILTAARPSESVAATWDEIDLDAKLWTIPGVRMKSGREHRVPLSEPAVELLRNLPRIGDHVFPGRKEGRPVGTNTMLRLLAGKGITVHGFRSSFRDWAGDRAHFPREVIEHALAHSIGNRTEAAYRRSDALEKRAPLMEAWAAYCGGTPTDKVVNLHAA